MPSPCFFFCDLFVVPVLHCPTSPCNKVSHENPDVFEEKRRSEGLWIVVHPAFAYEKDGPADRLLQRRLGLAQFLVVHVDVTKLLNVNNLAWPAQAAISQDLERRLRDRRNIIARFRLHCTRRERAVSSHCVISTPSGSKSCAEAAAAVSGASSRDMKAHSSAPGLPL